MKRTIVIVVLLGFLSVCALSFRGAMENDVYHQLYHSRLNDFDAAQEDLKELIRKSDLNSEAGLNAVRDRIHNARRNMKGLDFWTRYLDPVSHRLINGPLPVELARCAVSP